MSQNENIRFYQEHQIAPAVNVKQNHTQFLEKRKKLYRQLGIPLLSIDNKDVIEFGASCGENSLPLIKGFGNIEKGVRHIDIVEPNKSGRDAIHSLFQENGIPLDRYSLYGDTLESFKSERKYDIIIAEQFLQHCTNWRECLLNLKKYAGTNAIIIITCADAIGLYPELMKRFVGRYMVRNIREFDAKVSRLAEIFGEYLNSLKGMNKMHTDYIADTFFDDFGLNGAQMNMADAIEFFKEEFDVFGASQNIFTDYSWYKDLEYDYISDYKRQYQQKKHMFMFAGEADETVRSAGENKLLEEAIEKALRFEATCEKKDGVDLEEWFGIVDEVTKAAKCEMMTQFNSEFKDILKRIENGEDIELVKYPVFAGSFGKASQYLSFVRK